MKFLDSAEQAFFPVVISVRAETAAFLYEMAAEMDISIDELVSGIAEDAVIGLAKPSVFFEDIVIPDSCSTEDLLKVLE